MTVVAAAWLAAAPQEPAPPVFTAEQATAGKSAYARSCASCHLADLSGNNESPPLSGAAFMSAWRSRSTRDLFDYIAATMPPGNSGLALEGYLAVAAFILQSNGAVAGRDAFTASTAVPIASLAPPRPAPPTAPISHSAPASPQD